MGPGSADRANLICALHDPAHQEPELCSLIRVWHVDSLNQALSAVLEHAAQRGDLPHHQPADRAGTRSRAPAALALLVQWGAVHDHPINDDGIAQINDGVLVPLL